MNLKHLGQDHLEGILRSALEKHGCPVELNTELLSFDQNEDSVTAHLAKWVYHHDHHAAPDDGHEPSLMDREEVATFQYLVGTDGARGTTRKLLGLSFLGETRHMDKLVVGDIRVKGLNRDVSSCCSLTSMQDTNKTTLGNFWYSVLAYVGRRFQSPVRILILHSFTSLYQLY